ncbi:MAG: DUF2946 family protein [Rhizomicrobium sp.]
MTSAPRAFAVSLALFAMLLRGLLPAGWMPAPNGSGEIVICTGHGTIHTAPRQDGHTLPDRGNRICPFAAVAHQAPPLAFATLDAPSAIALRLVPDASRRSVAVRRLLIRHSPRAPPAFA